MTKKYKLKQSYTCKSVSRSYPLENTRGQVAPTHSEDDYRGKLLDVSDQFRQSLWSLYVRNRIQNPDKEFFFKMEDKKLETNLNLFLSQVRLYERNFNVDGTSIIKESFNDGAKFAVKLKKQLQSGFLRYHGTPHLKATLKEFDNIDQSKYHQVFPFDQLPYWKSNKNEDYKYYFSPKAYLSIESRNKFKRAFEKVLTTYSITDLSSPSEYDIITAMKTSTILSEKYKFHAEERIRHPYLSSKEPRLRGRRAVIYVGPANERDSVVWDLESQEWISKAHIITMQILDKLPMSAMAKTIEHQCDREDDVKRFRKEYLHYVRDIKKCGLTMNVDLFLIIKEVLEEKFPRLDFSSIGAYSDILITSDIDDKEFGMVKGKPFRPITGHGLGSANSLTTLVQCILFQIRSDELNLPWNLYKSVSWNDDLLETIHCEHAHKIYNLDLKICKEFGLEVKSTHTGLLRGGHVFCEEYESLRDFDCDKDIKILMAINKQRFAPNIYCAKSAIRSIIENTDDYQIEKELKSLIDYWGYEFFPEEATLPATFGGWVESTALNIDTSLEVLDDIDDNLTYGMIKRSFDAEQLSLGTFPMKRVRRRLSDLPNRGKLWEGGIYVKDGKSNLDGLELDLIGWHPDELLRSFQGSLGLRYYPKTYWNDILIRRRKTYLNKEGSTYLSETELINHIINKAYPKYFSLPTKFIKEWSTQVTREAPIRSIDVPGYLNMKNEDPINLLANVCKHYSTAEVSCREVDPCLIELKKLELQGHIISVPFDKRYPMYRSEELDINLFNYTPIPLLLETYYYAKYASIPKFVYEGISFPSVEFQINVCGINVPRDVYVSRSRDPIRSISIAIAVLLCARVDREHIGSLLKQTLKDDSVTTLLYDSRMSDIFLRYLESKDLSELEATIKEQQTMSLLTPHDSDIAVLNSNQEIIVQTAREEECPVCMNENYKINSEDLFEMLSCCGRHIPFNIGHANDLNELVGDITELYNLLDESSDEDDALIEWDPGDDNNFISEELIYDSDEEILMSDSDDECYQSQSGDESADESGNSVE